MATATWNGTVIAQSDTTVIVEGNHYFPAESIKEEYFTAIDQATTCWWKGVASYYDVVVDGHRNPAAAWTYASPSEKAAEIKDHVAFYGSVTVDG